MQYNLKATGLNITEGNRVYVEKKLQALDKLLRNKSGARLDIELEFLKDEERMYRAEGTLHDHGLDGDFRGEARGASLHESIDLMMHEVHAEVIRAKKKHLHFVRQGAAKAKDILRGFRERF